MNQGERRSCGDVSSAFSRTVARCLKARDFLIGLLAPESTNRRRRSLSGHVRDEPAFTSRRRVGRTPASPAGRASCRGCHAGKRWSRPVSRVLYVLRRDSHSSRPDVAVWLQQPTREQRGPRYRSPIWSCSEWGLPCRTTLTPYAVRSYRTLSPLPRTSEDAVRRSALCCTGRQLTLPRRYLALCPVEPGLSSMRLRATRLPGRLHGRLYGTSPGNGERGTPTARIDQPARAPRITRSPFPVPRSPPRKAPCAARR